MSERPVVALDIDGTLAPWHEHFRAFIELYCGKECPPGERVRYRDGSSELDWDGLVPFYKWLGVSKATYRDAKLAFRQGGFKRWMPIYPGASDMVRGLRGIGAEVWFCTTRPYLRLDNIDPDTRHWIRRNRMKPDGVIFGEHKYRELKKIVGVERIAAVVDDLPEMVRQAHGLGLPVVLRGRPYNAGGTGVSPVPRVSDMETLGMQLVTMVHEWKRAAR